MAQFHVLFTCSMYIHLHDSDDSRRWSLDRLGRLTDGNSHGFFHVYRHRSPSIQRSLHFVPSASLLYIQLSM